ncbi:autotransporter domain-containing protein [Bradyrhizobium sp.]|uniref:autotransporter domain-containing protein n=1 Tax=Bradyrhizobium sp. TaxID=376 RepID=UPI00273518B6|nr:autotransporter domain-containing protein [Bradyrhizobium sp.]
MRRRVLLSSTMMVAAVAGYGRRAYAACVNSGGSTYQCSGANAATQTITANNASVSTVAGFSVNTAALNAITITGNGALSYTDTNASPLATGVGTALDFRSHADFAATPGSVTINTNGVLSGTTRGINARNYGTGAVTITANGNVNGTYDYGIAARNYGTALSVTTGAGTTVSGAAGMFARNYGTGAVTITANGDVSGTSGNGIFARNTVNGSAISVTTGVGSTVGGGNYGIDSRNYGTGALTITANGDVTGTIGLGIDARNNNVNGTNVIVTAAAGTTVSGASGIHARNSGTGAVTVTANGNVTATGATGTAIFTQNLNVNSTTLSLTTAAGTTVSGFNGIFAGHYGTGALTVTVNGDVTATTGNGIYARNMNVNGTALSVTTGAGTTVSGGSNGINARNYGTGALTITANGDVAGTAGFGIDARNNNVNGTDVTVTTAAGTTVRGGIHGINALNSGTGALTVTANGDVTGTTGFGIVAGNVNASGTSVSVTTAAGSTVSGILGIYSSNNGTGALTITVNGTVTGSHRGIHIGAGAATVTVAGTVNGGAGGAIRFASAVANRLELVTGAAINGNVLGGTGTDTLGLSGTGSGSFNVALLSSFEAGQKTGSGAWTLTGTNAGIGTFAVSGGTLAVNGSLASTAMTVNAGGTLGGAGTVGNTLVSGGAFAPGSGTPGSSMTVNGTLGFNAASTYRVNVNPTTASFANVSGVATLGGATVNASFAPGSYISKQYTILTAGSISGTFGTLANTNLPANFHDTLSYDATHVYLNLALNFTTPASGTLNGNQNNVANALINSFNSNGGIPMTFATLSAPALSQASGQPGASTSQAGITGVGQFINGVFDGAFGDGPGQGGATGFAQEDDNANAYAARRKLSREAKEAYAAVTPRDRRLSSFAQRWAVWASAYGGNSRVNGDTTAGTDTTTNRVVGAVAGASYHFTPDTQAGFALGGAGSSFDIANGFGGGRADAFNAAVYAKHTMGAAYVAGLIGYSWQDTSTDRTVTIAGIDRLHASFQAQALATRLEGGWRYAAPVVGITPYAALQTTTFYLPSYGETAASGSNTFALNYASKSVTATRSEFGAKFDKATPVQGGVFTLKARAAWAHDWNTDRSAIATFQTLPGATFSVNGAQPSADAALASLGAEMKWHNGWTVAGRFDGEFSRTIAGYAARGSVRYAW